MDVNKTLSISPVGQGGSKQEQKRDPKDDKQDNGADSSEESGASPWQDTEAFAIGGLLAGNLDPKVSQALEGLASQIDPLRAEVELARGREAHFKEISEQHSFLPLARRRVVQIHNLNTLNVFVVSKRTQNVSARQNAQKHLVRTV